EEDVEGPGRGFLKPVQCASGQATRVLNGGHELGLGDPARALGCDLLGDVREVKGLDLGDHGPLGHAELSGEAGGVLEGHGCGFGQGRFLGFGVGHNALLWVSSEFQCVYYRKKLGICQEKFAQILPKKTRFIENYLRRTVQKRLDIVSPLLYNRRGALFNSRIRLRTSARSRAALTNLPKSIILLLFLAQAALRYF
ncbi:MAG: hypothetical protein EBT51_12700, partial [Flavobacteriaceae bacterium]|nr:hypothetical protein [Flavobacteriaceae bacterium]